MLVRQKAVFCISLWLRYLKGCNTVAHPNTVNLRFTDTRLIRTPHHYGQVALSPGKESPHIFCKFNPLDADTPLLRTLSMAPSVSVLTGYDCIRTQLDLFTPSGTYCMIMRLTKDSLLSVLL